MKRILENSHESFYWVGFILADGHINEKGRLKVGLSQKDLSHLEKLRRFLELDNIKINERKKSCKLQKQDDIFKQLACKFNIENDKTYNPPDFREYEFNVDLIKSLIIGFIDGDGSITRNWSKNGYREDSKLSIKTHINWFNNLEYISEIIGGIVKVNKNGYCKLSISKHKDIKDLKMFAIENSLPILERKWDNININYITKTEKAESDRAKIKALLEKGKSKTYISKMLDLSLSKICNDIKRNKKYYETK